MKNPKLKAACDAAERIPGWMSTLELRWLAAAARDSQVVVEFGTFQGRSAKAMLGEAKRVYCVDKFDYEDPPIWDLAQKHLRAEIEEGRAILVRASTSAAPDLLRNIPERPKMVFIDAGHNYEEVVDDIVFASEILGGPGSGGLLCGHDYQPGVWDGVVRAVNDMVHKFNRCERIWYTRI